MNSSEKKSYIVVLPFGLRSDTLADYEKRTGEMLSRQHIVIQFLYAEGISLFKYMCKMLFSKRKENFILRHSSKLYTFIPFYIIPFQRISWIRRINFYVSILELKIFIFAHQNFRSKKKIFWSFSLQTAILPHYFHDYVKVYDCIDDVVSEDPFLNKCWTDIEKKIMQYSDLIFCNTPVLFTMKKSSHKRVYLVPSGFDEETFKRNKNKEIPSEMKSIKKPIIGFVGNINKRLDFQLIRKLAEKFPYVHFVFIGREDSEFAGNPVIDFWNEWNELKRMKNVIYLGERKKDNIPQYIRSFTIGGIFYDVSQQFNAHCFPLKFSEYFYEGIPVISTPIESIRQYEPYVKIISNDRDGYDVIRQLLATEWPDAYKKRQKNIAINNSWERKVSRMIAIIEEHMSND